MRVAALYDIHGNLPALEAVLEDVSKEDVDRVVVGGDVVPGPMPCEALERLMDLDRPVQFIAGNGELAALAQMTAPDESAVTYWGTTSGGPPPEAVRSAYRWTVEQVRRDYESILSGWPKTLRLHLDGLGEVLFCHGTPRSETEIITRVTDEDRLLPLFQSESASVVVCGHTHMQYHRTIGRIRLVNAGSVGAPYGEPGAYWLLLDSGIRLRHTTYDLAAAAERIRATAYPLAREFANAVLQPSSEEEMLGIYAPSELTWKG